MSAFGILSYGAYIPRRRISRAAIAEAVGWAQGGVKAFAKGVKAYGEWDEDSITMAVAAARHAHSGINPDRLCFASTTAPCLARQNAGVVAAALDCPPATHTFDVAGSERAATSMLVNAPRDGKTLLVAADRRPTRPASTMEMLSGDAAAAVTLGFGAPVAEILGASALQADFVDHYRTAESSND